MAQIQQNTDRWKWAVSGALAGAANGLFGGGGGMILVPLLLRWLKMEEKRAFASSVAIILPLCLGSTASYWWQGERNLLQALPYLLGGWLGGALGGRLFRRASPRLLRTLFALFLRYGGIRCLIY
ncbi:MAG: sulfite exporter TauE/SafE family protein [Clostridiales bacterium]|nr:sulfite exporter TauE/SafE family protein [Clostridiales bacterium]